MNIIKQGLKWNGGIKKVNICYADGHIEYSGRPAAIGREEINPGWGIVSADFKVPAKYWDIN